MTNLDVDQSYRSSNMTDDDLDHSYSALCQALGSVGQQQAPLLLSMLCLSMLCRMDSAAQVLPLIDRARAQCDDTGDSDGQPPPGSARGPASQPG